MPVGLGVLRKSVLQRCNWLYRQSARGPIWIKCLIPTAITVELPFPAVRLSYRGQGVGYDQTKTTHDWLLKTGGVLGQ
jgi:hypothetical protein